MIHVRNAQRKDVRLLMQMILEMGQHERLTVFATEEPLVEDGFGATPKFPVLIAEDEAEAAGYALFFDCYSSFQGSGIFLEDLFLRDDFRGKGVGKALLSQVAARVIELEYFGIMSNVLDWNQSALHFFESAGASELSDRKTLCLTGAALREIAESESLSRADPANTNQARV
jgi:GNAT superfamily N-acetyltransferase